MKFVYRCEGCNAEITIEEKVSDKPAGWQPDESIGCDNCGSQAIRIFGCSIGIDNKSDEVKHIGQSLSHSNIQFVGKGFADTDRRLENEVKEIEKTMAEPATSYDIEAGKQAMTEIEREKGKPVGSISGEREQEEVTIKAVSAEDAEKHKIANVQKLGKQLQNEMVVGPEELRKINNALNIDIKSGETVTKKMSKRRGADVLAEEAKKNRLAR